MREDSDRKEERVVQLKVQLDEEREQNLRARAEMQTGFDDAMLRAMMFCCVLCRCWSDRAISDQA
jgi:hypothetical protein